MRTRFLNIDFFGRASDENLINTIIFSLPVPHLPPRDLPIEGVEMSSFDLSSEIGPFPLEKALSQFFSFVLPPIHDDSHVLSSQKEKSLFHEVKNDETWRNVSSDAIAIATKASKVHQKLR